MLIGNSDWLSDAKIVIIIPSLQIINSISLLTIVLTKCFLPDKYYIPYRLFNLGTINKG